MAFLDALEESRQQSSSKRGFRGLSRLKKQEAKWGYIFISLWIIGFLAFGLIPMIASFYFSLLDFQLAKPDDIQFIGLENWRFMLFEDELVYEALRVTFVFAFITLPIGMVVSLLLAILLNSEFLWGKNIFRTLFYMPTMVPGIAATLIWGGVLNSQTGWLNKLIETVTGYPALGLNGLRWLDEPRLVYFAYTFIGLWGIGNAILINLASLQGVPTDLYEAAKVDGAGWWARLRHITLPMISPVIFYNLIIGLVGLLRYFETPFIFNGGNGYPEGYTRFFMIHFYNHTFSYSSMGYGSTLAWLMFFIGLAITIALFGTAKYWVYYAGEQR